MSDQKQEIISVADVADGNPSTAWSLAEQLRQEGGSPIEVLLKTTSVPANYFHKDISADHHEAHLYTANSEEKRLNRRSRLYAATCFGEFAARLSIYRGHKTRIPSRWTIIQEHQLLGASRIVTDLLGITDIRVVVPDVFPKESAKHTVENTPGAHFSVWNTAAQKELEAEGFEVELHKPYLLDGYRPSTPEFMQQGKELVIKSSGNGMPVEWEKEIVSEVARSVNLTWGLHTTRGSTSHKFEVMKRVSKRDRIQNFYDDLGGNTRLVLGYPSELVGVVCDLRSRGVPVWMICLPPRGAHELRNLLFAMENNLVLGEFVPSDYHHPTSLPGLRLITAPMISQLTRELPEIQPIGCKVGTEPFWQDAA